MIKNNPETGVQVFSHLIMHQLNDMLKKRTQGLRSSLQISRTKNRWQYCTCFKYRGTINFPVCSILSNALLAQVLIPKSLSELTIGLILIYCNRDKKIHIVIRSLFSSYLHYSGSRRIAK